jgi:cation transport protein ChaC
VHWVFGYGSLMWNPGFPAVDRHPAQLDGYQRAFCRYSFRHRGTRAAPGLVIGLREGGACVGRAFLLDPSTLPEALAYLDEREGAGYHRLVRPVHLKLAAGGRSVPAWVYVPNPKHPSYFGRQDLERIVELVAHGRGESGTALDYLTQLVANLKTLGVEEPELLDVLRRAEALRAAEGGPAAAIPIDKND